MPPMMMTSARFWSVHSLMAMVMSSSSLCTHYMLTLQLRCILCFCCLNLFTSQVSLAYSDLLLLHRADFETLHLTSHHTPDNMQPAVTASQKLTHPFLLHSFLIMLDSHKPTNSNTIWDVSHTFWVLMLTLNLIQLNLKVWTCSHDHNLPYGQDSLKHILFLLDKYAMKLRIMTLIQLSPSSH